MTCLLHVLELMEQYLTPHDACKLACVSKSMQEALIPIEEGVFRKHKNIKLLNECVCNSHGSLLCTHVNPGGKMTKNLSVPMPLGASSKCKLRELEAYKRLWGNIPITCKIELKPEHYIKIQHLGTTITISDVFLFTTKSYMKEVRKVCDMRSLCVSECLTPPEILAGAGGHQKFFQVDLNQDWGAPAPRPNAVPRYLRSGECSSRAMSAEEEIANYKQELGCALKDRNALRDILRVASKEDVSDDVDEYLASVILSRQRVDELSKLNARIDFITDVLLDQLD